MKSLGVLNKKILILITILCAEVVVIGQPQRWDAFHYSSTKNKVCNKAAVVCAHPIAAQAGLYILQKGGNAVDAAIATQWALAVVYPGAGNIGGGGFMVARLNSGKTVTLDYRERAPSKAGKNMYVDSLTNKANSELSQNGHLACGVPGTPAGLFAAHKYAKLPMKVLIQPAIELAEKGFALNANEASSLNNARDEFLKYNTIAIAFIRNDRPWKEGDTLIQTDLANTLKRIRDNGLNGFYGGVTAGFIVDEMQRGHGLITKTDLKNYRAVERSPVDFTYRGYRIISMAPPSSGGVMVQQMLSMLSSYPLKQYGYGSVKATQLMIEVERRSFADRSRYLGDPDFYKVPVATLTGKKYVQQRMSDYDSTKAGKSEDIQPGVIPESEETTHISIMDAAGNAVAVTTTLNGHYGSKTIAGKAGFLLNNEMDDFSIQEGIANMYGAVGGRANEIQPGKRMLSSMTPTIVLKQNKPFIVVGTPGGTTIITSVLQSIVDVVDFGMNAGDAVNKPKFHHQWLPDLVDVETDFNPATISSLQAMGYIVKQRGSIGRTEMIIVRKDGKLEAAADHRGYDSVSGY